MSLHFFIANIFQDIWQMIPQNIQQWLENNIKNFIYILIILIAAKIITKYGRRFFERIFDHALRPSTYVSEVDRRKRLDTLNSITNAVVRFAVWITAFILILGVLGVNTAPLFASVGIISAAIAFGSQSIIKDLLSGIFIITENQYRVGDTIDIMGVSGTVESIGLRTTVLRDINGNIHHVPNGSIIVTTNRSVGYGRINLDIAVAPETDMSLLEHTINHAGQRLAARAEFNDIITEPPHYSRIVDYAGNAVTVKILGKTVTGKQLKVKSALLAELKKDFEEHKIKVATTIAPVNNQPPKK